MLRFLNSLRSLLLFIPTAVVFRQLFLSVFRPQFAVPINQFDRRFRQAFFNVDFPSSNSDKAFFICSPLPNLSAKSPMYLRFINSCSSTASQNFEWRTFTVFSFPVSEMRKAIMRINSRWTSTASSAFPHCCHRDSPSPRLNAELTHRSDFATGDLSRRNAE